jgi:hypothetical protein
MSGERRRGRPPRKKIRAAGRALAASAEDFARWRADPVAFIEEVLVNPKTGKRFLLAEAQKIFLRNAFEIGADGRLRFQELVWSGPKKSGKSTQGAMAVIYIVLVLGGKFAEAYCCANDLDQSRGRIFQMIQRIVAASPLLASDADIGATTITFRSSGATIQALAADWRGAAGGDPIISVHDELWGATSEASQRLFDELIPPPTQPLGCRLTCTYAGFSNESTVLEALYKRGLTGEQIAPDLYAQPGMLMFWTHDPVQPWQDSAWIEQMRQQHRPLAFLRQIQNRWVTSEDSFIDPTMWDACCDPTVHPVTIDKGLSVYLGVDASVKKDSTAIVAVAWDYTAQKCRLVAHRILTPSAMTRSSSPRSRRRSSNLPTAFRSRPFGSIRFRWWARASDCSRWGSRCGGSTRLSAI